MYANPFMQSEDDSAVLMCVSVLTEGMREEFFHIRVVRVARVGEPQLITGREEMLDQFKDVRILGSCDGSCRSPHPGTIGKMMQIGPDLREEIINAPGFREVLDTPPKVQYPTT